MKLKNGDVIEVGDEKYRVIDDSLWKVDPGEPPCLPSADERLQALEQKIKELEEELRNRQVIYYPYYINPQPTYPAYNPQYTGDPIYPSITWGK